MNVVFRIFQSLYLDFIRQLESCIVGLTKFSRTGATKCQYQLPVLSKIYGGQRLGMVQKAGYAMQNSFALGFESQCRLFFEINSSLLFEHIVLERKTNSVHVASLYLV